MSSLALSLESLPSGSAYFQGLAMLLLVGLHGRVVQDRRVLGGELEQEKERSGDFAVEMKKMESRVGEAEAKEKRLMAEKEKFEEKKKELEGMKTEIAQMREDLRLEEATRRFMLSKCNNRRALYKLARVQELLPAVLEESAKTEAAIDLKVKWEVERSIKLVREENSRLKEQTEELRSQIKKAGERTIEAQAGEARVRVELKEEKRAKVAKEEEMKALKAEWKKRVPVEEVKELEKKLKNSKILETQSQTRQRRAEKSCEDAEKRFRDTSDALKRAQHDSQKAKKDDNAFFLLECERSKLAGTVDQLKVDKEILEIKLNGMTFSRDSGLGLLKESAQEREAVEKKLGEANKALEGEREELRQSRQDLDETKSTMETVMQAPNALNTTDQLKEMSKQVQAAKKAAEKSKRELADKTSILEKKTEEIKQAGRAELAEETTKALIEKEKELIVAKETIEGNQSQIIQFQAQVTQLQTQISQLQEAQQQAQEQSQQQQVTESNSRASEETAALRTQIQQLENDMAMQAEKARAQDKEIKDVTTKRDAMYVEGGALENERNQLQAEKANWAEEYGKLQKLSDEQRDSYKQLEEQKKQSDAECQRLTEVDSHRANGYRELETELNNARSEAGSSSTNLASELSKAKHDLAETQRQLKEHRGKSIESNKAKCRAIAEHKAEAQQAKEEAQSAKEEVEQAKEALVRLGGDYDTMQKQLAEYTRLYGTLKDQAQGMFSFRSAAGPSAQPSPQGSPFKRPSTKATKGKGKEPVYSYGDPLAQVLQTSPYSGQPAIGEASSSGNGGLYPEGHNPNLFANVSDDVHQSTAEWHSGSTYDGAANQAPQQQPSTFAQDGDFAIDPQLLQTDELQDLDQKALDELFKELNDPTVKIDPSEMTQAALEEWWKNQEAQNNNTSLDEECLALTENADESDEDDPNDQREIPSTTHSLGSSTFPPGYDPSQGATGGSGSKWQYKDEQHRQMYED